MKTSSRRSLSLSLLVFPLCALTSASASASAPHDWSVEKTGPHSYVVRVARGEPGIGMELISRSARIVPEIRDGKGAGFRLYSVRPDGPLAKLGMQNGDVIQTINGVAITSPAAALDVYAKLKSARLLSVAIQRNAQPLTLKYRIVRA